MDDNVRPTGNDTDDAREWLRIARQDLTLAEYEIAGVGLELRAFHAQQAAEKALKGVCVARDVEVPFTHDIALLIDVLEAAGLDVKRLRSAARLTPFATAGRYPSRTRPPSARSFARAVAIARKTVEWAEQHSARGSRRVQERQVSLYAPKGIGSHVPDQALLDEVIERVVRVAAPERIILFGSGARGKLGPHSDLDLLVVTEQVDADGELEGDIHEALAGLKTSFDVVAVTPGDLARYGHSIGLVYRPALEEGRVLYRRHRAEG